MVRQAEGQFRCERVLRCSWPALQLAPEELLGLGERETYILRARVSWQADGRITNDDGSRQFVDAWVRLNTRPRPTTHTHTVTHVDRHNLSMASGHHHFCVDSLLHGFQ